ncbi:MAG: hypothetical protein HONBIEJF_01558 [Fimbriimonadaceae bacterium]|nr:hypothetical protein [Fimbriimonadaceae bacterium]
MTIDDARIVLLAIDGAYEGEHMGHPDFRLKKGIFASLWPKRGTAVLRLPPAIAEAAVADIPGSRIASKVGGMGWIELPLGPLERETFRDFAGLAAEARR